MDSYVEAQFAALGSAESYQMKVRSEYGETKWLNIGPADVGLISEIVDRRVKSSEEVHWPTFVEEFAECALQEALWWEGSPNDRGVGGFEWETAKQYVVADIASPGARTRWMQMCREYVAINMEYLADLPSDRAGQMFWQSKRGGRGVPERDFLHAEWIPESARHPLHTTAGRWPVGYLFIRDEKIYFDL
ncbi:hypothetical protein ACJ6WD_10615 [Streptomyces sp. VTCC 41912]|uniref:hypothetical protein n=1 Tax=Streptomyces sp. VTCC 41912 TaxID=3383243 RepID=UPI003896DBD8